MPKKSIDVLERLNTKTLMQGICGKCKPEPRIAAHNATKETSESNDEERRLAQKNRTCERNIQQ